MAFKHIISRENLLFKQLKKLADHARERRQTGKTLMDGVHLIEAYIAQFGLPELLIIPEGQSSREAVAVIQALVDMDEVPTVMLTSLMFAELAPVASPTGVLALIKTPLIKRPEQPKFVMMLEDIQDPGNLGAMLRSAAAAGVDVVYCSTACTDVWSPKALRGGQGAQFILPVQERANLVEIAANFDGNVYATSMNGESLFKQDLTKNIAFMVGNEGGGLSRDLMNVATMQISIPMFNKIESLNATAAATVCLFERVRQMQMIH